MKNKEEFLKIQYCKIVRDLGIENPPLLLVGKEAKVFIKNNSSLGRTNGAFLYENLNEKYFIDNNIDLRYLKTGVVCLVKLRLSTLAHELQHAKQFEDGSIWMNISTNNTNKTLYKIRYFHYPSEEEAFKYAVGYLLEDDYKFKSCMYNSNYELWKFFSNFNFVNKIRLLILKKSDKLLIEKLKTEKEMIRVRQDELKIRRENKKQNSLIFTNYFSSKDVVTE